MQKPNITVAGIFNLLWRSTPAKVSLSLIALLALMFVLLGGPPAGALAQDEPTATETLAAFDSETPTATDTLEEPTATEEPTQAAETATQEPTATETFAESETPTLEVTPTPTETVTETPIETPTIDHGCGGLGVDSLCTVAEQEGSVRVIVELEMPYTPPAQLSAGAENAQEAAIENNQEALEAEMDAAEAANPEAEIEAAGSLETMPYVAYSVDAAGLAELAQSPLVAAIYENHLNTISLDGSVPLIGADVVHTFGFTGDGQTIAILDTGVLSTHNMFTDGTGLLANTRVVEEACYSWEEPLSGADSLCAGDVDSEAGGLEGPGSAPPCTGFSECDHGTHVAGIAAGDDLATHVGVAPDADIIAIQVFTGLDSTWCSGGCSGAFDFEIIMGLERVLELQGSLQTPDIAAVNLSLGGGGYTAVCDLTLGVAPMKIAIDNLRAAGIATIIASGNNGLGGGNGFPNKISYPACISTAVSVGSTSDGDVVSTFSNRASFLALYAPGESIESAGTASNSNYVSMSGTSMAAPHVAGAFALLQEFVGGTMSVTDALNFFKNNGDPVTGVSTYNKQRIDVLEALQGASVKPIAPTLLTIANNGYSPSNNTPALTWSAVANAENYEIQIDTTNTFVAPLSHSATEVFPGETETTPALLDGIYYWRVRALNQYDAAGPWSAIFKFTVDTILPANVTLSLPAHASTINTIVPKLTWMAATGAVKYQVQVSEDGTWTTIDLDHTTTTAVLFYQVTNAQALHPELQYWRVRAIDIAGNPSTLWTERTFTPLLLQSPANGAFTTDQTPLLKWFAATGALNIEVQLDNTNDFSSPEVLPPPLAGNLLQYQAPDLALGLQYWRLRIETTAAGWSEWSPVWSFTVSNAAPAITVLVSPLANALTNDTTPDLAWNAVAGADHYQLQIDNTMDFSSPEVNDSAVPSTTTTSTALGQGVQNWRVRAIDSLNQPGPWSLVRKFTVDSVEPVAATLMMPVNLFSSMGNPNFTWTKPADMVQSRLEIDAGTCPASFTPTTYEGPFGSVVAFKPTSVQFGGTGDFCWRVTGKDAAGNEATSSSRDLTITPILPLAPGPISPATASFLSDTQPDLIWNASAYSDQYHVQVASNSTFTMNLQDPPLQSGTTFEPAVLGQGLWYWRVQGVHTTGTVFGPYSPTRTFTVDTDEPLAPTLTSPVPGGFSVGNPTFMWMKPVGSTQYKLQIDNQGDTFTSIEFDSGWITMNSFKPSVAQLDDLDGVEWRVYARDAALNPSLPSSVNTLTIKRPLPAAPALVNPPTGALSQQEPLLDWNASANGVFYRLQIATNATFTLGLIEPPLGVGVTEFTHPNTLADGTYYWRVAGWNGNTPTEMGPYSAARNFKLDDTDPLVGATLTMPGNAGSGIGNPTFMWTKPAEVTQTRVLIDTNGDFGSVEYTGPWQTTTSFKPTPAQFTFFGLIQWKVEGVDAAGNPAPESLETRTYTIHAPTPAMPVLISPANNGFTNVMVGAFDWANAANAVSYEIQIATDMAFTNIFDDDTMANSDYSSPFALDPNTVYFWRVRGKNVTNVFGPYSSIFKFTTDNIQPPAPLLGATPADGSTSVGNPTFMWMAAAGATQYKLLIEADGGDFVAPFAYESAWMPGLSFKPTALQFSGLGAYDWRVLAKDAAGNESVLSIMRNLTITVPVPPNVPTLLGQMTNNIITSDNTPRFEWTAVPYGEHYEIWVDRQIGFTLPRDISFIGADGSNNLFYQVGDPGMVATLPDGVYYWWVWGYNSVDPYPGQHSAAWSAKFKFTIDTVAPAAPVLSGPADLSVARNTAPTFMWTAAAGATKYRVEYDQQSDGFTSVEYNSGPISGTSHHPLVAPPFGVYQWRVWSIDAAGNESLVPSLVRAFFEVTEVLPMAPMLASPATNAMTTDNTPTLYWNSVVGADTYEIQIDNNNTFVSPEATGSGLVGLNFTSSLIPNGTYNWRVRALNSSADGLVEAGAWSMVRILKIVP